ncbi:MAG: HAD-IB family phosphatase [Nitrosopumilus sp.]|nr:HAD-IB family phosphatase [Nitrosopumilus sp.]
MISKFKLAVFDMDGTILDGRIIEALSKKFGLHDQIVRIQSDPSVSGYIKTQKIAFILKGIEEKEITIALESIPLMNNCHEVISSLKKKGFKIGIITDSYNIAAKSLVNSLDLDFFAANELKVSNGLITGEINMPLGWDKINCSCNISVCKRYHLQMYAKKYNIDINNTIAIGDTRSDLCMLNHARVGIAFMPKDKDVNQSKNIINRPNLMDVLDFLE